MEHVSSVHPTGKFPEKVENLKRWARFPGWNFRTECRVPFTFLVVCTSSRSTVGHRDVPGPLTTKWNNFLSIGNFTFAPTEISGPNFETDCSICVLDFSVLQGTMSISKNTVDRCAFSSQVNFVYSLLILQEVSLDSLSGNTVRHNLKKE